MNTSLPATSLLETFKRFGLALWRRAWLLLMAGLLGAAAGYLYSQAQTPMYRSSMRVMALRPVQERPGELTYWMRNPEVAQTYAQLGQTAGFSQKVIQKAGAIGFVSAFAMPESQFIVLSVQTANPKAAVPLLEAGFEALNEEINTTRANRYLQMEESLSLQMEELAAEMARAQTALNERQAALAETELEKLEAAIFEFENQLAAATPGSAQASQIQTRLLAARQQYNELAKTRRLTGSRDPEVARLERTLSTYQNLYNNLTVNRQNAALASLPPAPPLIKVEEPFEPLAPYTPRTRRNTVLAALAAFGLGLALALGLEYLSDTLKPGEALRQRIKSPLLGQIPIHAPGEGLLAVESDPRSPSAEAYRILRTNLAFSAIDRPARVILLTSPGRAEGKTTLAANLAAVLSQAGREVLLVDANLRRPGAHKLLDLHNRLGLSDAMRAENIPLAELIQAYRGENGVNFSVLTSGALPPNPLELLTTARMKQILEFYLATYDVIILDAPHLALPDAQVLASYADGVLLVGLAGRTHIDATRAALERLAESRARVLGLILNKIPGQVGYDRGGY